MRAAEDPELNFIRNRAARRRGKSPRKKGRGKTEILWSADSYDNYNYANSRKKRNDFVRPAYLGAYMTKKKCPNVRQCVETLRRTLAPNSRYGIVPQQKIYVRQSYERSSRYEADNRILDCCARPVQSDSSVTSRDSFRTEEFTDTSQYSRNTHCRNYLTKDVEDASDQMQRIIIENQEELRCAHDGHAAPVEKADADAGAGADGGGGAGRLTATSFTAVMAAVDAALKYTHAAMAAQGGKGDKGDKGEGWQAPRESVAVGTGELVGGEGARWMWEGGASPAAPPGERPTHAPGPAHAHGRARATSHAHVPPAHVTAAIAAAASAQPVAVSIASCAPSSDSRGNSCSESESETLQGARAAARAAEAEAALWRGAEQGEAAARARGRGRRRGGGSTPHSGSSADGPQGDVNVHIRLVASNGVLKAQAVLTNADGAAYEVPTSVEWAVPSPGAWREVRSTLSAMHCAHAHAHAHAQQQPPSARYPSPPASPHAHARGEQARARYAHVPSPPAQPAAPPRRRSRGATAPAQQFAPSPPAACEGDTRANAHGPSAESHMGKSGSGHQTTSQPFIVPLDISRCGFGVNPITQQIFVARPIPVHDSDPNTLQFTSIPQDAYQSHPNTNSTFNRGSDPSCTFNSFSPGNFQHSLPTNRIPGMDRRPQPNSVFTSQVENQYRQLDTRSSGVCDKTLEAHWPRNTQNSSTEDYPAPPTWQSPASHFRSNTSPHPPSFSTFWRSSGNSTCLSGFQPRPGYVEVNPPKMVHSEPSSLAESFDTNVGKTIFQEAGGQGKPNDPNSEAMKFEILESLYRKLSNVSPTSNDREMQQSRDAPILPQKSKTEPVIVLSNSDDAKYLNQTRNAFLNNPFISCSEFANIGSVVREQTTFATNQNVYSQSVDNYPCPFLDQTTILPNPYKTINNDKSNFNTSFATTEQGSENAMTCAVSPPTTKRASDCPFSQAKFILDAGGATRCDPRPSEQWLSFVEAQQAQRWQAGAGAGAGAGASPPGPPAPARASEGGSRHASAGAGFSPSPAREAAPGAEGGGVSWLQLRSLLDDMRARNQMRQMARLQGPCPPSPPPRTPPRGRQCPAEPAAPHAHW